MKKVFFLLFIGMAVLAQAQDNKPTKEETVAFIKRYFETSFSNRCEKYLYVYKNYKIDFNSTLNKLDLYWEYDLIVREGNVLDKYRMSIDLSKIESVKRADRIVVYQCNQKHFELVFEVATGKDYRIKLENAGGFGEDKSWKSSMESVVSIPIFIGCENCGNENLDKVQKAFNHLRKLCGAPEPIKFD